jgi:hypothetical protein
MRRGKDFPGHKAIGMWQAWIASIVYALPGYQTLIMPLVGGGPAAA